MARPQVRLKMNGSKLFSLLPPPHPSFGVASITPTGFARVKQVPYSFYLSPAVLVDK